MNESKFEVIITKSDTSFQSDQFRSVSNFVNDIQQFNRATGEKTFVITSYRFPEIDKITSAIEVFRDISQKAGGEIKLLDKYGYFPVLIDKDQEPFPLYSFVEVLDGLIEYNEILEEIPSITLDQVHNTITFLRKLAAINIFNADIDEIEEIGDLNSSDFIETIINAGADKGVKRVLYHDK